MPDFETLYPGRFLKGKALEAPKVIRVLSVAATDLEGEDGVKAKAVLKYKAADGEGEIVWCKTNAALLAAAIDERDFTKWPGHYVTIHFDPTVKLGPEAVGGIRVMGSPEMKAAKKVEIKRPRRKRPDVFVLVPTDKSGKPLVEAPSEAVQP